MKVPLYMKVKQEKCQPLSCATSFSLTDMLGLLQNRVQLIEFRRSKILNSETEVRRQPQTPKNCPQTNIYSRP